MILFKCHARQSYPDQNIHLRCFASHHRVCHRYRDYRERSHKALREVVHIFENEGNHEPNNRVVTQAHAQMLNPVRSPYLVSTADERDVIKTNRIPKKKLHILPCLVCFAIFGRFLGFGGKRFSRENVPEMTELERFL